MKKYMLLLLAALTMLSCGTGSGKFRIKGRFRNLNQGTFLIYSPDGGMAGLDTVQVSDGRFSYTVDLDLPATFVIIFPNNSEQPVFGEPGKTATLKGDVTHLRELQVKGTKENELMTHFRHRVVQQTPPQALQSAVKFIKDNPETKAAVYVLYQYFIANKAPDYKQAAELATFMHRQNPDNLALKQLKKELDGLKNSTLKATIPSFTATDMAGQRVNRSQLKGRINVIAAWATWNYQSLEIQRRLKRLQREHGSDLGVMSICLDGDLKACKRIVDLDSLRWHVICTGDMWQTPIVKQLGIADIPTTIITDQHWRVIDRDVKLQQLEQRIGELLALKP